MLNPSRAAFLDRGLPLLIWIAVIFLFSTDTFSASVTSGYFASLLRWLFPGISDGSLVFWHGVMRKTGHVTEYFVLAVLAFRAFCRWRRRPLALAMAMAVVVAVALSDELHQTFTALRSGSMRDVGYDCAGGLAALCCLPALARTPARRWIA